MTALGLVLSLLFVPNLEQKKENKPTRNISFVLSMFNPLRIFGPFIYPNVFLCHFTCGLLSTFQYALLTSARSIFDPRFNLTSPLVSGLFYLSPGIGFLIGSVMGGRLSDRAVRKWIVKRNGIRLPQDRLNSGLATLFLVLPIGTLIYAWTLEEGVGGMPVPIIAAFFAAIGLLGSFNGLNTYSAEVMPHIRSEVISGKYVVQYLFAAGATAAVDPLIGSIGVGWTFTISKEKVCRVRRPNFNPLRDGTTNQQSSCQRCHAHKIKCSGTQPCIKCTSVGVADECAFAPRDRQVKVSENYLEQLVAENRRLKEQSVTSADGTEARDPPQAEQYVASCQQQYEDTAYLSVSSTACRPVEAPDATSIQNPLIGDRAWFHRYDPSSPPIYIGEAACSAFATRFRRFLTGNNALAHIARTQWTREATIAAAANEADVQWPSLHHARLLVRIAIHQIGYLYHLMMRKATLDKLEEIYLTGDFDCLTNKCKFFALFAFGQAYSIRSESTSGARVPGTAYFAKAMNLVQILPERTSVTHLETLLLLSLFSYYLNRRHSAYGLIGTVMRLSLTIGLNHNIPESQLIDPVERQHRIQIWWTIYIFDRMWGSKMGLPMQILDEDIHVDMPSPISPQWRHEEELSDPEYMTANIKLARIVGETITKLYSRRKYQETFLQRVQKLLKALKNWVETLPESLRLNMEDLESSKKPLVSLHMAFNQCIILTTRPTLLHLLITLRKAESTDAGPEAVSQPVLTLSEACIHAARHSHSMILTRWINGTMPTFGYFHAHYLFSSALILAMSSFVPIGNPTDMSGFDSALDLLRSMTENGNLAAAEFYHNLEQVKLCLDTYRANTSSQSRHSETVPEAHRQATPSLPQTNLNPAVPGPALNTNSVPPIPMTSSSTSTVFPNILAAPHLLPNENDILAGQLQGSAEVNALPARDTTSGYTTEMAFLEPTMQDFLAQSDIDLGLLHPVDTFLSEAENLYTCHEL
ncbi:Major facilitator superfamily domain general substrate transporter [Penicillium herquei]|nr:Major facilitator superfamily domain general substrate transporter [Penicillium herquei]